MSTLRLTTPVAELHRVGKNLQSKLAILGITKVRDILFHFPFRYEDYRSVVAIANVMPGVDLTIKGTIELIANKRSPRKRTMITEAVVRDETDVIRVIWFGQPFIGKILKVGDEVFLSGTIKEDMFGVHMASPAYERVREDKQATHTARIVPMYPLTSGVTQKQMRFLVEQVLPLAEQVKEWIPESILKNNELIPLSRAIQKIHFPENHEERTLAEQRLKFGELFVLQLRAELIRQANARQIAPNIGFKEKEIREFVQALPFELTVDQKKSAWEIFQDIDRGTPMNRLLQGDVGSGKTIVAGLCAYLSFLNGYQTVIMAPTEILATQHFETFGKVFGDKLNFCLLTGSEIRNWKDGIEGESKVARKLYLKKEIFEGRVSVIIGTHALLTEDTQFHKLGLVVIDEQHRFGVEQRKTIRDKSGMEGMYPHFLSMTATPIPRSYALTLYGDLDVSYIKTKPAGRKDIITRLVEPSKRDLAYGFIREQVHKGRQVFVVCPLIQEKTKEGESMSVVSEKKTVLSEYEKLSTKIFPDLRVDYLHGKMKSKEKEAIMKKFAAGETDILVSTSVIEVGVNIPNASIMMIEGAERFGLAQLHQFRGRVGRAEHQSYCILFTGIESVTSKGRLEYFAKTLDGFALAEYDLETRGPGEVYGTAQSGMEELRLATMRDQSIIKAARESARGMDFEKFPELKNRVQEWEARVHME
ncbi:MAG: ATP-dependent DNA helicase RecG [Candidatus Magasanikbacteria bacterium]|nr:ATP-dependent DNA helicase RecG [Candidatus Magasanikbacteria bacterium]